MKKRLSVRTRVTIWYVISLIIIMAVATVIVLFSTIRVFENNAKESLKNFVDQTVDKVSLYDGKIQITVDFLRFPLNSFQKFLKIWPVSPVWNFITIACMLVSDAP